MGFFQYDMLFNDNIIEYLYQKCDGQNNIYFPYALYDFEFCNYTTWNERKTQDFIINDYEKYYGVDFSKNAKYPLNNSYILHVDTYEKIMKWITQLYDKIYPWCMEPPNATHFGHIGGIFERVMGYAIGNENMTDININVSHDHNYKWECY